MAFVGIKVDDRVKELWVTAASGEGVSLSEWIRRCAAARLGVPLPGVSAQQAAGRLQELAGETTVAAVPADEAGTGDLAVSEPQAPASDPTLEARLAEARRMIGGAPKQFKPDFKKEKGRK